MAAGVITPLIEEIGIGVRSGKVLEDNLNVQKQLQQRM